jgi:hypothetical protein
MFSRAISNQLITANVAAALCAAPSLPIGGTECRGHTLIENALMLSAVTIHSTNDRQVEINEKSLSREGYSYYVYSVVAQLVHELRYIIPVEKIQVTLG